MGPLRRARLPLGYRANGLPLWPLSGAEEKDEAVDPEGRDKADLDEDQDNDEDKSGGDDPKALRIADLSKENARRRANERKLEADLAIVTKRLQDIDDKDKSDLEKAQAEIVKLTERLETQARLNREGAIERAFLKENKASWHNPEAALKLLDQTDVKYDENTGEVEGMSDAVKRLSKDHPYLVDEGKKKDDADSGDVATGATFNGDLSRKNGKRSAERTALEKRFPILGRM